MRHVHLANKLVLTTDGRRYWAFAVFVERDAWYKTPSGFYGWVREVGTKRRELVTRACLSADAAVDAAMVHVLGEKVAA